MLLKKTKRYMMSLSMLLSLSAPLFLGAMESNIQELNKSLLIAIASGNIEDAGIKTATTKTFSDEGRAVVS